MNLILNASEALDEDGGTITLRATERGLAVGAAARYFLAHCAAAKPRTMSASVSGWSFITK